MLKRKESNKGDMDVQPMRVEDIRGRIADIERNSRGTLSFFLQTDGSVSEVKTGMLPDRFKSVSSYNQHTTVGVELVNHKRGVGPIKKLINLHAPSEEEDLNHGIVDRLLVNAAKRLVELGVSRNRDCALWSSNTSIMHIKPLGELTLGDIADYEVRKS